MRALTIICIFLTFNNINAQTLKEALGKYFLVGVAAGTNIVYGIDDKGVDVVRKNFECIVPENSMKCDCLHPEEDRYDWTDGDRATQFAYDNGMTVIGHCLVWHSQVPKWMFITNEGKTVNRWELIDRMYHHITAVVKHYKEKKVVKGWDVVNEAFNDDGTMRHTPYYDIIGEEYIELAFRFAHAADPDAELYYNDYSLSIPAKREAVCRMVRNLRAKGVRLDAVGMQSHLGYADPDLGEYEKSIEAFAACGVKVMITELDLNMLPNPPAFHGAEVSQNFAYDKTYNPYTGGLDKAAERLFEQRYLTVFDIYRRHADVIQRVTLWGVSDNDSWMNDWPIKGRTNYPLLFDRDYRAKPVVKKILEMYK